jgi:hypothetical protein
VCYTANKESKGMSNMIKDVDDGPNESARIKAERMWSNYDLTKRFLEEVNKKEGVSQPADIAEVIINEKPRPDSVTKFQRKFVKYFKSMLNKHKRRNVLLYRLALLTRLEKLKAERTRRLALQEQPKKRDLFA